MANLKPGDRVIAAKGLAGMLEGHHGIVDRSNTVMASHQTLIVFSCEICSKHHRVTHELYEFKLVSEPEYRLTQALKGITDG